MYKRFYKLQQSPFRLTPDPYFLYMTAQHREALSGLIYSVCTRPGLTLLVGEVGTGKTMLLYTLMKLLKNRQFSTVLCTNPSLTPREFYDFLLAELGVDCPSPLKSRQLMALQQTLLKNRAQGRPTLLIVDEAQRLSPELLEEIRLLLNLETPREKLLEIIVSGQPELWEILRRPEFRQLKQRISYSCKLKPLNMDELREYLHHRLTRAGLRKQTLFPEATIHAIYEYTQGIPRLVNTLCDNSLQIGFVLKFPRISVSIIKEAAADLDLRPTRPVPSLSGADEELVPVGVASSSRNSLLATGNSGQDHKPASALRIPLESYAARQKSLGFFAGLVNRLR